MQDIKILIVEDEYIIAMDLKMRLQSEGYQFVHTDSGEQAVELAATFHLDLILMDIMLNGKLNGIEAAERILSQRKIPLIYLSSNSHLRSNQQLINTHPVAVLAKPVEDYKLFDMIEKATGYGGGLHLKKSSTTYKDDVIKPQPLAMVI